MENSCTKAFAEDIFPYIDEKPYKVLFSDRPCRPNTPTNIIIESLIIKEAFQDSDDKLVENLILDIRYPYTLHTTSFYEQSLSDKSLSRFRKCCYEYERKTGINLINDIITQLAECISKSIDITPDIKRTDSLMIEANISKSSRKGTSGIFRKCD